MFEDDYPEGIEGADLEVSPMTNAEAAFVFFVWLGVVAIPFAIVLGIKWLFTGRVL